MDSATRVDRIIHTATDNLRKGVILEPRFFFDEIAVPNDISSRGFSTEGVFKNGYDWPIQITKMIASLRYYGADGVTPITDERLLQRIGLRISSHGTDYMSREFNALPLWQSRPIAMTEIVAYGLSSCVHDAPWILSARDSMRVECALDASPGQQGGSRRISVAFTGYGLQTERPYFKAGSIELTDTVKAMIVPDRFRNDGDEPIVMTDMTAHVSAPDSSNNPQGDTRLGRIQVSQIGNGTQADWFSGPTPGAELMPISLLGTRAGRAVVHEFPRPLIWEPGEGLQAEVAPLANTLNGTTSVVLALGFMGTLVMSEGR